MSRPMPRSILAATDLSHASDAILRAAEALAARTGAELHVATAIGLPPRPVLPGGTAAPAEAELRENQHALDAQVRRVFPGRDPTASRVVVYDAAYRAVLGRAAEVGAELIVLGPHRAGTVNARFLGTTADRVIRAATVPCLVVRAPLTLPLRRIGVPTDLSRPAREALEVALEWSAALAAEGGEVRVVHAARRRSAEAEILPALEAEAPEGVRAEVVWARDPVRGIAAWAEREEVELLVAGTRGGGGAGGGTLGGTASALALRTGCPVLLVPPAG